MEPTERVIPLDYALPETDRDRREASRPYPDPISERVARCLSLGLTVATIALVVGASLSVIGGWLWGW